MLKQLCVIAISYMIVITPACRTTSEENELASKNDSNKKFVDAKLDEDLMSSLKQSQRTIFSLLRDQNFIAQDSQGMKLDAEEFFKHLSTKKDDVFLVDNTSAQTRAVMIGLKMDAVIESKTAYVNATSEKRATHIAISSSVWNRSVTGKKQDYIASSKKYSRLSYDKDTTVRNLKSTLNAVVSDLSQQARGTVADKINRGANKVILGIVALFAAAVLFSIVLLFTGKSEASAAAVFALPAVVAIYGGLIAVIAVLVKGVAWVMNRAKTPEEAFPDFELY